MSVKRTTGFLLHSQNWAMTGLILLLVVINFADKVILGLAAPLMMDELGLSAAQIGLTASAFFVPFAAMSVAIGFVANRVATRRILLVLAITWSAAQLPILLAAAVPTLILSRIALGAAEGPTAAVATHALHKWFPDPERGLPTAIMVSGASIGLIVAPPFLSLLINQFGWRSAFVALIVIGLVWALIWLAFGREGPEMMSSDTRQAVQRIPYRRVFTSRSWLGAAAMCFVAYWAGALALTWLPAYLERGLGFSVLATGGLVTLPPMVSTVALLAGAGLSQRLLHNGSTTQWARVYPGAGALLVSGVLLIAAPHAPSAWLLLTLLDLGFGISSMVFPLAFLVIAELVPVAQRAACLGVCVAGYSVGGMLAPVVSGAMISGAAGPLGGFDASIQLCALLLMAGGVIGAVSIRPQAEARPFGTVSRVGAP